MFETRLGCLGEEVDPDVQRFIRGVNDMLALSEVAYLVPRWARRLAPVWKRFVRAWDDISDVGEQLRGLGAAPTEPRLSPPVARSLVAHRQEDR